MEWQILICLCLYFRNTFPKREINKKGNSFVEELPLFIEEISQRLKREQNKLQSELFSAFAVEYTLRALQRCAFV